MRKIKTDSGAATSRAPLSQGGKFARKVARAGLAPKWRGPMVPREKWREVLSAGRAGAEVRYRVNPIPRAFVRLSLFSKWRFKSEREARENRERFQAQRAASKVRAVPVGSGEP